MKINLLEYINFLKTVWLQELLLLKQIQFLEL